MTVLKEPDSNSATRQDAPADGASTQKLSRLSVVGYGAGDAANNLAFTTAAMFLLVYYTDVAKIPAAAAGTLLLVVRIFDAFSDVFAGRMVDKTYNKRFGKFRPFLIYGSIPLLLLSAASFTIPDFSLGGKLVYAYITYAALGLAYSLVNIPYGSLAGAMTQLPGERAKLASGRSVGAALVGAGLGVFVAPLIVPGARDLQHLFTMLTIGFAVVGTALYFFTAFTAKETVHRAVPKVSVRQSLRTLKGNKPLLMLCISSFFFLIAFFGLMTVQLYYLRDVLHSLALYPVVSIAQVVVTILLGMVMPRLVRGYGKRAVYISFGALTVVGGLIMLLTPGSLVALGFAGLMLAQIGGVGVNMVVWALEADTVEYGEWKTRVRSEGITYALFSFTRKAGQAVGGALAAYALAWGGYHGGLEVQSAHAQLGIRIAAGLVPAVAVFFAMVVMMKYSLTDAVHAKITRAIANRKSHATGDQ